jgi:uncharacterized protein
MWVVFDVAGYVLLGLLALGVGGTAFALAVAAWVRRGHAAPLKRLSVFVLDFLYLPLKMAFGALGRGGRLDELMVALRNRVNARCFARAKHRLLLAPQCLRHLECPAPGTRRGILCQECGRCKVGDLLAESRRLGYSLFLLTGSAYIPTLVAEEKPDAALLVACPYECNKVMMALRGLPTVAVWLDRDGCVATDVNLERVVAAMQRTSDAPPAQNPTQAPR